MSSARPSVTSAITSPVHRFVLVMAVADRGLPLAVDEQLLWLAVEVGAQVAMLVPGGTTSPSLDEAGGGSRPT